MIDAMKDIDDVSALKLTLNCILESVSEGSYWEDFDNSWNPIISTLTAELFLDLGMKPIDEWYIYRGEYKRYTLKETFTYLNSCITDRGFFGTDFWDECQFARFIVQKNLKNYFPSYELLHKHIIDEINNDLNFDESVEWNGPAFLAVAIEYLSSIEKLNYPESIRIPFLKNHLINKLINQQHDDGFWKGYSKKSEVSNFTVVWHTSQTISALNKIDGNHLPNIQKACDWLVNNQENDGYWPSIHQYTVYFTCYAIIALSKIDGDKYRKYINKALNFIKLKMDSQGRCSDLGGTLMCALTYWELTKNDPLIKITMLEQLLVKNAIKRSEMLSLELQTNYYNSKEIESELNKYKSKYQDADIILSKKDIFFITLIIALIGILLTISLTK